MTIIAGFRCQGGIVVCADTQETSGTSKRSVTKLQCFQGPVASQDRSKVINPDLALAICGAGDGPFIDKIASQAWDVIRYVSDVWEAARCIESMIKDTYKEFGQIYQTGSCPHAELIYGVKMGGYSLLFQATGPLVNEMDYASSGIGYYLADFLTSRMRGSGWLTIRQSVTLAAYILYQAKEHVEGCGGDSHIAVLRESDEESSGMVNSTLIHSLTEFLKHADYRTGEMLLTASDFSVSEEELSKETSRLVGHLNFMRLHEMTRLQRDRDFLQSVSLTPDVERDEFGLPVPTKGSDAQTSEDQQ